VVRHRLVGKIVAAYEEFDVRNEQRGPRTTGRQ
jgi:phosphate starvation-inducible protein PhoH